MLAVWRKRILTCKVRLWSFLSLTIQENQGYFGACSFLGCMGTDILQLYFLLEWWLLQPVIELLFLTFQMMVWGVKLSVLFLLSYLPVYCKTQFYHLLYCMAHFVWIMILFSITSLFWWILGRDVREVTNVIGCFGDSCGLPREKGDNDYILRSQNNMIYLTEICG